MARRVVAKSVAGKRVVRSISKTGAPVEPHEIKRKTFVSSDDEEHDDEQYIEARNRYAREHGIDNSKPAERISRVVTIQFSAGNDMRKVDLRDFTQMILDKVGTVRYGEPGIHGARMGGYYIVDGKLCHDVDMDWDKENFKDGRTPPEYAGGPKPYKPPVKAAEPKYKAKLMTSEEIKLRYPTRASTVRHHKWSEQHLATGRPDAVINEEQHAKHIADKLKAMREKNKKSASSKPASKRVVVKKKVEPTPVKKRVVVRRAR